MKIHLTSAYSEMYQANWLKSHSSSGISNCSDDPAEADVIIFVESHPGDDPYFRRVFTSEIYKKFSNKCVLYHDADFSVTPLRTISPSIEAWQYNPKHKRTAHYIARHCENTTIDNATITYNNNRLYLYSFIGSRTHKIRSRLFQIRHDPTAFLKDTTGLAAWKMNGNDKDVYEKEYYDVMKDSFFILAPRGIGPCSYRLFETMQIGRTPVIISDEWVKISDIQWDKFSITVPENKVHQVPDILRERREEAVSMGIKARECWENFFSPKVSLDRIAESAIQLVQNQYSFVDKLKDYSQFLTKLSHLENYLRYRKNKLKKRLSNNSKQLT